MNHQDYDGPDFSTSKVNSAREELVSNTIQAANYAKLLLEQPGLATANTPLSQHFNTLLMGLINTRTADGKINLFDSMGPIYPGSSSPTQYFAEGFEKLFNINPNVSSTPGNAAMRAALGKITGQNMSGANFDDQTIKTLSDKLSNFLQPAQWVKVAKILQLDTGS